MDSDKSFRNLPRGIAGLINVTKPHVPELERLIPLLEEIWASGIFTNGGQKHRDLEEALALTFGLPNVSLFCNATIALMVAQRCLGVKGKVITTAYSFVATSHALTWMHNEPIFVDIEPDSLCIDPEKIEAAITDDTVAIMPLHCYGNVCDTAAISVIAKRYGLKVIYDACHSFGVQDEGGSALRHGDASAVSFHATKVFNTLEGGMLVTSTPVIKAKVDKLKNFGFTGETSVIEVGLNGKMSEFNAAIGLLQLQDLEAVLLKRRLIDAKYRELLDGVPGISCLKPVRQKKRNYAYFPIFVDKQYGISRDTLYELLKRHGVHGRRYFHPLISDFPMYKDLPSATESNQPVARSAADSIICLPIYPDLALDEAARICEIIRRGE